MNSPLFIPFVLEVFPSLLRIVVGIGLFTFPLTMRKHARVRASVAFFALYALYLLFSITIMKIGEHNTLLVFSFAQFITYALLLLACVVVVMAVYDTSVWTALFCCAAGYTVQNLSSGMAELIWTILGGSNVLTAQYHSLPFYLISVGSTIVIFSFVYLFITRTLRREGLERLEDKSMILIMALTIMVIIGFDVLIKWLTGERLPLLSLILLRLFHGLACIFTLITSFQIIIARRFENERNALRRLLGEREHQYEQSKESIAAINARVHSIRHSIARLAENEGMSQEAMKDLVQQVQIYDSRVMTGNEALDVVLSEKRLMLENSGTSLTYVADGAALLNMASADIYTLFAAMLEGTAQVAPESVSLIVRDVLGSTSIHLEYLGGTLGKSWMERIASIINRYHGSCTTEQSDGHFRLSILFPGQTNYAE